MPKKVTGREVTRALSKQQRAQFSPGEISEIAGVLNQFDEMPGVLARIVFKSKNLRHFRGAAMRLRQGFFSTREKEMSVV